MGSRYKCCRCVLPLFPKQHRNRASENMLNSFHHSKPSESHPFKHLLRNLKQLATRHLYQSRFLKPLGLFGCCARAFASTLDDKEHYSIASTSFSKPPTASSSGYAKTMQPKGTNKHHEFPVNSYSLDYLVPVLTSMMLTATRTKVPAAKTAHKMQRAPDPTDPQTRQSFEP